MHGEIVTSQRKLRPGVYKSGMKVGDLDEALTDPDKVKVEDLKEAVKRISG